MFFYLLFQCLSSDCPSSEIPSSGKITLTKGKPVCIQSESPFLIFGKNPITLTIVIENQLIEEILKLAGLSTDPVQNAAGISYNSLIDLTTSEFFKIKLEGSGSYTFVTGLHIPTKKDGVNMLSYISNEPNLKFNLLSKSDGMDINYTQIQYNTPYTLNFALKEAPSSDAPIEYSQSPSNSKSFVEINNKGKFYTGQQPLIRFNSSKIKETVLKNIITNPNYKLDQNVELEVTPKIPFIYFFQRSNIPSFTYQVQDKFYIIKREEIVKIGSVIWNVYSILMLIALILICLLLIYGIFRTIRRWVRRCKRSNKSHKKSKKSSSSSSSRSSASYSSMFYNPDNKSQKKNNGNYQNDYYLG